MELQCAPTASRKVWSVLKLAFFMMKNVIASKRKLLLDINLLMKRGKSLRSTVIVHHHHHQQQQQQLRGGGATPNGRVYGPDEYEFSCSNTPNPGFLPVNSRRRHGYFPCIGAPPVVELDGVQCSPQITYKLSDVASAERCNTTPISISDSLAEDGDGLSISEVDSKAEEFINKFYQQLLAQRHNINSILEN